MSKLKLPLEVGKQYVTRGGVVVTLLASAHGDFLSTGGWLVHAATGFEAFALEPTMQDIVANHEPEAVLCTQ